MKNTTQKQRPTVVKMTPVPREIHVVEIAIEHGRTYIYGMTTNLGTARILLRKAVDTVLGTHLGSWHSAERRSDPHGDSLSYEIWGQVGKTGEHFDNMVRYAQIYVWSQDDVTREQALKM